MAKPTHIDNPVTPTGKNQREIELENTIQQWQQAYQQLQQEAYVNSLGDDKVYRLEKLNSINNLTQKIEILTQKFERLLVVLEGAKE